MGRFAAHHLLPGVGDHIELVPLEVLGEGRRGGVADHHAFAVVGDEVGVGHARAGRGAVPGEHQVGVRADPRQVRQLAEGGGQRLGLRQLQLLDDVGDPVLGEALPGGHLHGALAQHGPHGHLDGPGVGRRHDADQEVVGDLEHLTGQVDGLLQARLHVPGAVVAAEQGAFEVFEGPAGALGAGAGRKIRSHRPGGRFGGRVHDVSHPCRWTAPRWEGVARRGRYTNSAIWRGKLSGRRR